MKKYVYILLITLFTSAVLSSCTEEEVKPKKNGGSNGSAIDPK